MPSISAYMGAIPIELPLNITQDMNRLWEEDDDKYFAKMFGYQCDFYSYLSRNHNLKNLHWTGECELVKEDGFADYREESLYLLQFSSPISFNINIKESDIYDGGCVDLNYNLEVIYDGVVFLAYIDISDHGIINGIGRAVREALIENFRVSNYNSICIGPCPLRFSLFDELTYLVEDKDNIFESMLSVYNKNKWSAFIFYEIRTIEDKLMHIKYNTLSLYSQIKDYFKEYLKKINPFSPLRQKIHASIFNIHCEISDYEYCLQLYNSKKTEFFEFVEGECDKQFFDYYKKDLSIEPFSYTNITSAIKYIDDRLAKSLSNNIVIIAATIGAILGSGITAFLAQLGR